MEVIYIECKKLETMEDFYDIVAKKLNFPDYFGRNLDALSDSLDDVSEDVLLTFYGYDNFAAKVGKKAEIVKEIIASKRDLKPNLHIMFE